MANFERRTTGSKKGSLRSMIVILMIVVLLGGTLLTQYTSIFKSNKPVETSNTTSTNTSSSDNVSPGAEPQFVKQGELRFLSADKKEITKIDIEIADKEETRTQGLMFRKSMRDDVGMLFLMPKEEMQNFWMRNTYISLDIIFIDKDKKIVTIQKNTNTLSDKEVPSSKPAFYVLEVNAGYSDAYKLKEGDYIDFKRSL
jgi:hypothetical protein